MMPISNGWQKIPHKSIIKLKFIKWFLKMVIENFISYIYIYIIFLLKNIWFYKLSYDRLHKLYRRLLNKLGISLSAMLCEMFGR